MDDDGGGDSGDPEAVLQVGHGHLIHVDDGGKACKKDADIEYDLQDPSSGHAVHDPDQVDEHKAGASRGELRPARRHGRYDDAGRHQGRQGIEEGHYGRRFRNIFVLGQVGPVDDRAVSGNGQGKEGLSEGVDPEPGIL